MITEDHGRRGEHFVYLWQKVNKNVKYNKTRKNANAFLFSERQERSISSIGVRDQTSPNQPDKLYAMEQGMRNGGIGESKR